MPDISSLPRIDSAALDAVVIPSCAVMVMSCDAYRDLWTPFFALFRRFWPDCPFPLYLGSNRAVLDDARVTTLAAGDYSWSKVLYSALQRMHTTHVLLLLEDFFLDRPVVTGRIFDNLKTLYSLNGIVLRLFPHPGPDSAMPGHSDVGKLHPGAPYRVSAQAALWHRPGLIELLRQDESVWDFEWKGTVRSRQIPDGFYSTYQAALSYRQVVERGEWFWTAARYYDRQQIGCDFTARSVMSPAKALKKTINRFRRNYLSPAIGMHAASRV